MPDKTLTPEELNQLCHNLLNAAASAQGALYLLERHVTAVAPGLYTAEIERVRRSLKKLVTQIAEIQREA